MSRIIDDPILWDALFEYDELSDFYEYDIENEEFRLTLSKMEEFTVNIKRNGLFTEETLNQLNLLLEHMESLKDLMLRNTANERMDATSIFEHVTSNI